MTTPNQPPAHRSVFSPAKERQAKEEQDLAQPPAQVPPQSVRLNKRGIPVEANDWTDEDWLDLHRAMKRVIRKIAKRHKLST